MTGAGGASLPASQTTIYYIQTGRPLAYLVRHRRRRQREAEEAVAYVLHAARS